MATTESTTPQPAAVDVMAGDGLILDPTRPASSISPTPTARRSRRRSSGSRSAARSRSRTTTASTLVRRLPRVPGQRADLRPLPDARCATAAAIRERRWDTARICAFSEISAFYGLAYWYTWQVTILGLGPIFQSENEAARKKAARAARRGRDLRLRPLRAGARRRHLLDRHGPDARRARAATRASGGKYYIGNGNEAGDGLGVRPDRGHRGARRLRLLRRRLPARRTTSWSGTSSTRRTTSASSSWTTTR